MNSVSGIYVILNMRNGKVYLGQAVDIRHRWRTHKAKLNNKTHHNRHLQAAWNKYGAKAFQFKILEYCSVDQLDIREQHYLDTYLPKGLCYNIAINAEVPTRGLSPNAETRLKLSEAGKRYYANPVARQKVSQLLKGHQHSAETRDKIRRGNSAQWIVISPNGEGRLINNLRQFCRENDLNDSAMSAVAAGKFKQHKGWKCRKM